jgi:signal-transduction protein with cAMP-binding, CBS, and nucleotidyltransferase domain
MYTPVYYLAAAWKHVASKWHIELTMSWFNGAIALSVLWKMPDYLYLQPEEQFQSKPRTLSKIPHMRIVKDILASKMKSSNYVQVGTSVLDALSQLDSVNLSYLIVLENNEYKGLFCERDYSRNVILKGRSSNQTRVEEVMTADLPRVALTDSVEYCMNYMNEQKTRYLLAYNADKFVGVVTIHDLLRQVIANKEDVFDSVANSLLDNEESGRIY